MDLQNIGESIEIFIQDGRILFGVRQDNFSNNIYSIHDQDSRNKLKDNGNIDE